MTYPIESVKLTLCLSVLSGTNCIISNEPGEMRFIVRSVH